MFKCPDCPYQTKRKCDLPKHLLCHKPSEEVPLYKCEYCEYVTKRKGDLPKHILNHKDLSNLKLYDCSECDYKTKRKNDLHKHMLVHCDRHVAGVFKCLKCTYATDKVNKFSKHALSDCRVCEDVISLEHLMLEDIIASVESDSIQFVQQSEDGSGFTEEKEYAEECSDDEELVDSEQEGYLTEQYIQYNSSDADPEVYRVDAGRKGGVFNTNLGEFSMNLENNFQSGDSGEQIGLKGECNEEQSS